MTVYTNPDSPVLFFDWKDVDRLARRRPRWLASFIAKQTAMTGAAQSLLGDTTITQPAAFMGAEIGQCVHVTIKSEHRDLYLVSQNPSDPALMNLS